MSADMKFLVVDDFSTMRRIVRGLLKEIGYNNCEEAEDGAEARKEDIVLAAQSGAAGYIVKPFTKATLEEKVAKIMQKLTATA